MDVTPATILLVEDHIVTRCFLADNLAADGFCVVEAQDLAEARRLVASVYPDLAILDLGLPDGDGLELLSTIRDAGRDSAGIDPDLPVIVLSGRSGELDRLRGFGRGADDYVSKPLGYQELLARVRALLRRGQRRPGASRIRVGPLELDGAARRVWVRGAPVALSRKEFDLLRLLASDPDRVFTRDEIARAVWGYRDRSTSRTLDSHAFRLRRKLAASGDRFIVNIWGVGLRLLEDPR